MGNVTAAGPAAAPGDGGILQVSGLKKHFGGVRALDGVSFSLRPGEIHALVGENGAGKTTLIKVLSGVYPFDAGEITLGGRSYIPANPHDAKAAGLQVVHQEFNLLDHLSVAENVSIEAMPTTRLGLIDRAEMNRRARVALDRIGLSNIDVQAPVRALGIAHRQLVEIARALQSKSAILILDEPTATLTDRETTQLFGILRGIRDEGVTIVFVTHHLEEVFEICDRVTVFRSGQTIVTETISETTPQDVVHHMVGHELADQRRHDTGGPAPGEVALRVRDLRVAADPHERGVSFDLRYGEILGIAGLVGSGRTELLRGIVGADPVVSGDLERDGVPVRFSGPRDAMDAGIAFVTEDRKDEGLILDMSIAANVSLVNLPAVSSRGFLHPGRERDLARQQVARLRVKCGSVADPASSLSGGNQQKVVLAKWLARRPRVLVLDEPTRGVDVGAKAEIYAILEELARDGVALLIVSSELSELTRLADRILVMFDHSLSGSIPRSDFSEERILKLAYGQTTPGEPHDDA